MTQMINKIQVFLGFKKPNKPENDFSDFFYSASSAEKKKLLKAVIRKANQDQRDLVKKYYEMKAGK